MSAPRTLPAMPTPTDSPTFWRDLWVATTTAEQEQRRLARLHAQSRARRGLAVQDEAYWQARWTRVYGPEALTRRRAYQRVYMRTRRAARAQTPAP